MLEALQIDAVAACRQGLHGDAIAPRCVVESIEALLQIPAPIPQGVDPVENLRGQRWQVQQLFEEAIVVAARPAPHDGLHLDIFPRQGLETQSRQRRCSGVDVQSGAIDGGAQQQGIQFQIVLDVGFLFAFLHLVERRLCNVDMPALDEYGHLAIEERQQQRSYVTSVNVSVSHNNDAVVAQLVDVEIVTADSAAQGSDESAHLRRCQHLVEARLLDVEDFPLQREDGLSTPV